MEGFISHGDTCLGCRHIFLYAFGPDFKKGTIVNQKRELTDISATVAELLHFETPYGKGKVMTELFK
jgi:phosphopentomutase